MKKVIVTILWLIALPAIYIALGDYYGWFDKVTFYRPVASVAGVMPQKAKLCFVGDIMLDRAVLRRAEQMAGGDLNFAFEKIIGDLDRCDLLIGNLEGTVSDKGRNGGSPYSFRMKPEAVGVLKNAGFDGVTVANNHAADWGLTAFVDSIIRLEDAKVWPIGGGMDKFLASQPVLFEVAGEKVAALAWSEFSMGVAAREKTPGISVIGDLSAIKEAVSEAKKKADIAVVFFHFGEEYSSVPNNFQKKVAEAAISGGADVIVGHHPHVLQPIEELPDGRLIAYSLGNFVFDQNFSTTTLESAIFEVDIADGKIIDWQKKEVLINENYQPEVVR